MPALPLDEAGKYVAAAYLILFALVLVYVAIMAARVARIERDIAQLDELAPDERRGVDAAEPGTPATADRREPEAVE